jgi:hypothetical protein
MDTVTSHPLRHRELRMRRGVSGWFRLAVLTLLLFALGPVATAAQSENYGQYSLMTQRHAGQLYSGGSFAGQWSWTSQGNEFDVLWGDPSKWPSDNAEHFIHSGDWVLLDGWRSLGKYSYIQRVNRELIGDGSCQNMTPLPSDGGREHYVQWTIAPRAYCLQAWGTITEQFSGKTVNFYHSQVWSPPSPCSNAHLGAQTCIRQWETWSDNNGSPGTPITCKLERSSYLARGVGMGFVIDQTYPHPWHAELH